jgi:hypothetical protein
MAKTLRIAAGFEDLTLTSVFAWEVPQLLGVVARLYWKLPQASEHCSTAVRVIWCPSSNLAC